ncbi:hypothetical protein RE628_10830 [Paenibacillus sp. D2_2]|uniref:hypothetical protein n=1 Tax=Paenibacillus sp. D2_2 TaxID=3073092 RepID=UPI002815386F|nr:hypothetical protein [Paenibacillus sp. D2_2]WMT42741.1 hypothetical protein RE628_10830 [Paenibacillus sp. D2_2]
MASSTVIAGCGIAVICVGVFWLFDPATRRLPTVEQVDTSWFASSVRSDSVSVSAST